MAKKLYAATIETVFYFMAEEGQEDVVGKQYTCEALRDCERSLIPSVNEVTRYEQLLDVSSDLHEEELVYGVDGDITLREAFEMAGHDYKEAEAKFMDRYATSK